MPLCKDCLEPIELGALRCDLCEAFVHGDLEWDENCEEEENE